MLTDTTGPVELDVPRDRAATFEPQIVKKRSAPLLSGFDEVVLSLYAKGLTTGEISASLRRDLRCIGLEGDDQSDHRQGDRGDERVDGTAPGSDLRRDLHRRDRGEGPRRPGRQPTHPVLRRESSKGSSCSALARHRRGRSQTYAAIFIDAIVVKVRDGQVANRPFYAAIGVTLGGERDILGLWVGTGGEGAKFWMSVLTDLRNRGVKDTFFVVCDGLKGLPEVVGNVWPQAIVQTCIIHLLRNTFRLTSRKYWDEIKRDVKPIYTAVNATAARAAFDELTEKWGQRYPAVIRLWDNAWNEFIPFLDYDVEIRRVICSTNAIESLNARYRRAIKARGHFPSEQAALKCLYLVTRSLDPTGVGRARWTMRWKPALNAFAITFSDRFPAAETY